MITFRINHIAASEYEERDFYRSISAHVSDSSKYEIVKNGKISDAVFGEYKDIIQFVDGASQYSRIVITLPDNCLVLGRDWDKYINWHLDNNRPLDEYEIKRRMGLVSRLDNGVFDGFDIEFLPVIPQRSGSVN